MNKREIVYECAEWLRNASIPMPIKPGETKSQAIASFALAAADAMEHDLDPVQQVEDIFDGKETSLQRAVDSKHFTQDWYARHYGELEDWARKDLPEPYRTQFFNCIANGSRNYSGTSFQLSTERQLIFDQTSRAEEAELEVKRVKLLLEKKKNGKRRKKIS